MNEHGTKDALGNEIIIGNYYGYSVDSNGVTHTTVGKAVKFTPSGKLTLETTMSRSALWMDEGENKETSAKVSVKPAKVFPVDPKSIGIKQDLADRVKDNELKGLSKIKFDDSDIVERQEIIKDELKKVREDNEHLVVYYEDKPLCVLNSRLVEQQNLTEEKINILKNLHIGMHETKEKMKETDDKSALRELAFTVENLEFMMQEAWGFPKDRNYHSHWLEVPKCTCPKMDNRENYGTKYRVIDGKCPVHGKM